MDWISVADTLPEIYDTGDSALYSRVVLVSNGDLMFLAQAWKLNIPEDPSVHVSWQAVSCCCSCGSTRGMPSSPIDDSDMNRIVYWMPLPEGPKK